MLAKERQNLICEMLKNNGTVETAKLAETFDVSVETIRKDLIILENQNAILKIHGGAIAKAKLKPKQELLVRCEENSLNKRSLVLKAMEFISEGDVIVIDEGSTAVIFAEALKEKFSSLTIVTYSLDVMNVLSECDNFELVLCGGNYRKDERVFCGKQTLETLGNMHVQKAFIFPAAISLDCGICGHDDAILQLQEQMIKSADAVYILADSVKFEKTALRKLCDNNESFTYITDGEISLKIKKAYEERNIKLYIGEKR